jgi:hypothetical protein
MVRRRANGRLAAIDPVRTLITQEGPSRVRIRAVPGDSICRYAEICNNSLSAYSHRSA